VPAARLLPARAGPTAPGVAAADPARLLSRRGPVPAPGRHRGRRGRADGDAGEGGCSGGRSSCKLRRSFVSDGRVVASVVKNSCQVPDIVSVLVNLN
jgi:hypothetical protein